MYDKNRETNSLIDETAVIKTERKAMASKKKRRYTIAFYSSTVLYVCFATCYYCGWFRTIKYTVLRLLFGVNEKLLTQHISGLLTQYKLLYVSNQGRVGARAWARVRAKG